MWSPADLAEKAKRIELASRRLVDEQLASQYHSVFKGRGVVFADVRPYSPGDDVRAIDWNITARMNAPHVKRFVEERDRTVHIMIDMSASGAFGSRGLQKRDLAAELAAVVALSAIKNNDRVGLYLVTDRVERYVPPKKGKRHVMRLLGEILAFAPRSRRTDLAAGLDFLAKLARRRGVVFLISDFADDGWQRAAAIVARRHELVPVVVVDALETALPPVGVVTMEDLETGELVELDTSAGVRRDFARRARSYADARDAAWRQLDLDCLEVHTNGSYVDALIAFFAARMRRMR